MRLSPGLGPALSTSGHSQGPTLTTYRRRLCSFGFPIGLQLTGGQTRRPAATTCVWRKWSSSNPTSRRILLIFWEHGSLTSSLQCLHAMMDSSFSSWITDYSWWTNMRNSTIPLASTEINWDSSNDVCCFTSYFVNDVIFSIYTFHDVRWHLNMISDCHCCRNIFWILNASVAAVLRFAIPRSTFFSHCIL